MFPFFILPLPFGAFAPFADGVARTGLSFKLDNPLPSAGVSFGCADSFMFECDPVDVDADIVEEWGGNACICVTGEAKETEWL